MKLRKILDELRTRKKIQVGSGWEQEVYPYEKNPNFVIKKFHNTSGGESGPNRIIEYYKKYPQYMAKSLKLRDKDDYYLQEKMDTTSFLKDVSQENNSIIDKLYNYYSNIPKDKLEAISIEHEEWGDWTVSNLAGNMVGNSSDEGGEFNLNDYKINNIDDFEGKSALEVIIPYYMDYISETSLITNKKLYNQLKILVPFGRNNTLVGTFHEGNMGYDMEGNIKIIDI